MESLSDIVAQMRGRGEDGRVDRHLWNEYADRIEAAAKRVVVSKTETTTVGNAAAMREALDAALRFIGNLEIEPYSPLDEAASELRQRIMDALSAPARNCDRFADELEAQLAFLNEVWLISVDRETMLERDKYGNWTDEMRTRYGRWLLAPAAERKGEGK